MVICRLAMIVNLCFFLTISNLDLVTVLVPRIGGTWVLILISVLEIWKPWFRVFRFWFQFWFLNLALFLGRFQGTETWTSKVVTHPTLVSTFVGQLLCFRPVIHLVINNVPVDYRFLKKLLVKFITIGFEFSKSHNRPGWPDFHPARLSILKHQYERYF